jgi:UDP-4-amino-4,6-dideoxy-N-acetyl-beta-L-altrosamine N-acetyltransferase
MIMQIDYSKVYKIDKYSFLNFTELSFEQIRDVWEWRNDANIRKFMYNPDIIPFENHTKFVAGLSQRDDAAYWLVSYCDSPIGVVNLTNIDKVNNRAELGYYIIPSKIGSGLGIDFVCNIIDFVFSKVGVSELFGFINENNTNALILDSYMGFSLGEATYIIPDHSIRYISWTLKREDFHKEGKKDIRAYVKYAKTFKC